MRGQKQKYPVVLSEAEVEQLRQVVKRGKHSRREIQRAMLLWSAEGRTDVEIASLMSVNPLTVATTRERWTRKADRGCAETGASQKLDGKQAAFVVALACSDAPEGRESWTLQLLADKLVELKVVDEPVSYETVRATLKKTNLSLGKKSSGVSQR
jgi:DNA-binding CsgD family transcriptional regulator